jgi:hypothetical protein
MADARRVITGNALNQGAAIVGVQRVDATITKLDNSQVSQWSIEAIESGYDTRFDDYGLRRKTLELGDWDMDADISKEVAHGLIGGQWQGVRNVELVIRNDDDTSYYTGHLADSPEASVSGVQETNITIQRKVSGTFDGTDFNATSYNRGWATIWYE